MSGNYRSNFARYKRNLRWKSAMRKAGAADDWYSSWIGNPENHIPEYGFRVREFGDAVPGGYNGTFRAHDPDTDEYMGHISYNSADREAVIADLKVDPKYQRQGLATKLFDYAQRHDPDMLWSHGYTTPEGEAWRKSLPEHRAMSVGPGDNSTECPWCGSPDTEPMPPRPVPGYSRAPWTHAEYRCAGCGQRFTPGAITGITQEDVEPKAFEHPDPMMDNEPGSLKLPEHWGGRPQ